MDTTLLTVAADIFDKITLDPAIKAHIHVEMTDHSLRLSGIVRSHEESRKAEEIAKAFFSGPIDNDITIEVSKPTEDDEIFEKVESALADDLELSMVGPKHVEDGTVILRGSVTSGWLKNKAIEKAARIPGVRYVIGDVNISDHINDEQIDNAVEETLHEDPVVHAEFITSESKRGIVRLTGTVPNDKEKERAIFLASRVKGAREVEDDLDVQKRPKSEDEQLELEILKALVKNHINVIDVTISVIDGEAFLEGLVDSPEQIRNAEAAAQKVPGAKSVINVLVVSARK